MSKGIFCRCEERSKKLKDREWYITKYKHHNSAFSGYHYTYSDYSSIICKKCNSTWRTKANYVSGLRHV